jgi:hypothetical protein
MYKMGTMIEKYEFGLMVIDGKKYTSDVIIFKDHVQSNWWRKDGHRVCVDDLKTILAADPEVIIIGTGYSGCVDVPNDVKRYINDKSINLIIEDTKSAWRTFNNISKTKNAVGAFHLTC